MFKHSKRDDHSASKFSSHDSISKKTNKLKEEDSQLPTNSKKCKKKSFFHALRKKINSVFENKSKDSVGFYSSSKSLRSKSFEILTNSFEEAESQERVPVSEDSVSDRNKWDSKRSQSIRSKQIVCPTDYTVHLQTTTNATRTKFQHDDTGSDGPFPNSSEEKETETKPGSTVNNINNIKLTSKIIEQSHASAGENSASSQHKEEIRSIPYKNAFEIKNEVSKNTQKQFSFLPTTSHCKEIKKMNLKDLGLGSSPYIGMEDGESRSLAKEIRELSKYGWYWGPLNRSEAEEKLSDQPDGAFLVRDSSDVKYLLSLSFRSYGKTLHTRIEHSNGWFSFYPQPDHDSHRSLVGLINHCISESDGGVFCYSRPLIKGSPSFPVRLTKPVSRFMQVRSLQYLCRFVIRQYTSINHIQTLPLPSKIKGYLEESYY